MDAAARYVALLHDLRVARENQDEERIGMLEDALDALWLSAALTKPAPRLAATARRA